MLIKQIVKVTNSPLQCPNCGYEDFPWDDIADEDDMLVYHEVCQDCGQEFKEYCTDPEDIYLYTTYIKYIRGENSNMRW
jgi:predicted Zn-ribbon and HTH transcriptional regulator